MARGGGHFKCRYHNHRSQLFRALTNGHNLTVIFLIIDWEVIKIFVFHRKRIESTKKLGFWGILVVKTEISIFVNPKRHILASKHAFWRITRPNRSTIVACGLLQWKRKNGNSSRIKFKMTVGGHLVFENNNIITRNLIGRSLLIKSC